MAKATIDWTAEQLERLAQLWAAGHTAAEIGHTLGVSRSAVLGKIHRAGLTPPRPEQLQPKKPKTAALKTPPIPTGVAARAGISPGPARTPGSPRPRRPLTLFKLKADSCRYPLGAVNDRAVLFCGAHAGRPPYCEQHRRICFTGVPPRRRP